ncbi:uncharacterized protein LOC132200773 [Neocloeon triangulifer]|uniref:uncharacterized protein LOC132200773 n=1 Tax=Neocloeon triangulifer TaxID=2078957 RepID=UPI00286F3EE2|nr:uncharacterized protein LOC132200773 [Neocloeon triangulifer]
MSQAVFLALVLTIGAACYVSAAPLPYPVEEEYVLVPLVRVRRQFYPGGQFGRQNYNRPGRPSGGGYNRPGGFAQPGFPSGSASAANAQAQGFQSGAGFGANHAGTMTQGFAFGPQGITGSAGQAFSQNYQFPGGISASVSGSGTFGAGPGGITQGGANSVSVTGPNGQPIPIRG